MNTERVALCNPFLFYSAKTKSNRIKKGLPQQPI